MSKILKSFKHVQYRVEFPSGSEKSYLTMIKIKYLSTGIKFSLQSNKGDLCQCRSYV